MSEREKPDPDELAEQIARTGDPAGDDLEVRSQEPEEEPSEDED